MPVVYCLRLATESQRGWSVETVSTKGAWVSAPDTGPFSEGSLLAWTLMNSLRSSAPREVLSHHEVQAQEQI